MMRDIQHKIERFIARDMASMLIGVPVVPMRGWEEEEEALSGIDANEGLLPPYVVVGAEDAQCRLSPTGNDVWMIELRLNVVTHAADTGPNDRADMVRRVRESMKTLQRGYDHQEDIVFHGADLVGIENRDNESEDLRADVLVFKAGISG